MIIGYKCFNKGLINRYGKIFEIGRTYHSTSEVKFGNKSHNFHMCQNLEDTLRYFDAMNGEVDVCVTIGMGEICKHDDENYGYYDMYACESLQIIKLLTREEIILYGLNLNDIRVQRFIQLYKLTPEEIVLFKQKYSSNDLVLKYIAYYQEGNKEAFNQPKKLTR